MSSDISVGIQSKISAFEALASAKPANSSASKSAPSLLDTPLSPSAKAYFPITPSPPAASTKSATSPSSPTSPALTRKTSSIDLKDWVVEDGPLPYTPRHRKPITTRPPANGGGSAVRHVSEPIVRSTPPQPPPLIQFESPPNPAPAPPLPPRKASYSSLKSVSVSNSSSSSLQRSPNAPPVPLPPPQMRKKSDSLTVDHSYPPLAKLGISIPSRGNGPGHAQASSISSFHSVSLSSDGGTDPTTPGSLSNFVATYPIDRNNRDTENNHEPDNASLDESFENVSASSVISPTTVLSVSNDWAELVRRPEPPKLPQRPRTTPTSLPPTISVPSSSRSSNSTPVVSYAVRPQATKPTPPPPPPSRSRPPSSNRSSLTSTASDRSSIMSVATSRTSVSSGRPVFLVKPVIMQGSLARPTPIPPAARRRYEAVFVGNVLAQRSATTQAREGMLSPLPSRKRQAAGWRGLSVDLITNPAENLTPRAAPLKAGIIEEEVGLEERLDGRVVALVWHASKLERAKLRDIWNECDTTGAGSLNRDAFVKGMWRIDEELRKAQLNLHSLPLRRPGRSATLLH